MASHRRVSASISECPPIAAPTIRCGEPLARFWRLACVSSRSKSHISSSMKMVVCAPTAVESRRARFRRGAMSREVVLHCHAGADIAVTSAMASYNRAGTRCVTMARDLCATPANKCAFLSATPAVESSRTVRRSHRLSFMTAVSTLRWRTSVRSFVRMIACTRTESNGVIIGGSFESGDQKIHISPSWWSGSIFGHRQY